MAFEPVHTLQELDVIKYVQLHFKKLQVGFSFFLLYPISFVESFQYSCTTSGVEIVLEGVSLLCSCEGEEVGYTYSLYL